MLKTSCCVVLLTSFFCLVLTNNIFLAFSIHLLPVFATSRIATHSTTFCQIFNVVYKDHEKKHKILFYFWQYGAKVFIGAIQLIKHTRTHTHTMFSV